MGKPSATYDEQLLARLHRFSLQAPGLEQEQRFTPETLEAPLGSGEIRSHHVVLTAAVALVDALALRCPGTDEGRAVQLAEQVFELQQEHGFMSLLEGDCEYMTVKNAKFWDAGMAAILWVAKNRRVQGLLDAAGQWWRLYLDLAWAFDGSPVPCVDLAEGGLPTSRSACADFVFGGKPCQDPGVGMTGPVLLGQVPDTPMPRGATYRLPAPLTRRHYSGGVGRGGPVLSMSTLPGPSPLWMVGVTRARPAGAEFLGEEGPLWGVFGTDAGECPVLPPGDHDSEQVWKNGCWQPSR